MRFGVVYTIVIRYPRVSQLRTKQHVIFLILDLWFETIQIELSRLFT